MKEKSAASRHEDTGERAPVLAGPVARPTLSALAARAGLGDGSGRSLYFRPSWELAEGL